jgi:signal transduction histidine kinase
VLDRIQELKQRTDLYQDGLSRVLTIRANEQRLAEEQDAAFRLGEDLIGAVGEMIAIAGSRLEAATQKTMEEIDDTKYILYLLVGLGPLLSTWLGFVFISSLTSPVNVLVDATKKYEAGDLDHRVAGLRDEFGEVADAINEMAGSLKEQMLKMQRTEQMVVAGKLAAGLAHEIKNPLAGIKVAMHVLAEETYLSDEDREVVQKVGQEVTRLESLMKSFLDFARPRKPQPDAIDVNTLMNTTLAFHARGRSETAKQGSEIEIAKDLGSVPSTMADPMQMQQVFLNLVINAVDAMPDGGTLSVRTSYDEEASVISVEIADTGSGIDPQDRDKIFQPFVTSKPKGTGLGLAICKQIVEQHEGSITLDGNPGDGARFVVRLPLKSVRVGGEA